MYEAKQRSPGGEGAGNGCMGGQGYHHVVTEKGFFWQSVFSMKCRLFIPLSTF